MQTSLGPTQRLWNSEVSVFWRLLVIFPVGVAISIQHAIARFVALATRWLPMACCKGWPEAKYSSM